MQYPVGKLGCSGKEIQAGNLRYPPALIAAGQVAVQEPSRLGTPRTPERMPTPWLRASMTAASSWERRGPTEIPCLGRAHTSSELPLARRAVVEEVAQSLQQ
jgi:hypothetical protein